MNIHEYQAKAILREYGVPVSQGAAAFTPDDAVSVANELGGPLWVVKAQIHAGGRGKGTFKEPQAGEDGGVRLARRMDDVRTFSDQMLGRTLVTHQTGPRARWCSGFTSRKAPRSRGSFTCRRWWIAAPRGCLHLLHRGRRGHREGRRRDAARRSSP